MRKIVPVLFGVGGFLVVVGLVAVIWAPGVVKKTPVDVTSVTHLSGTGSKLNASTGKLETNPVKATSVTKTDSKVSDDKVVAWTNTSCLVIDRDNPPDCVKGDDARLISADTDVFATDRKTALAVNTAKYLPAGAVDHTGLVNKFPFDSEKKTYPYWDGTAGKALPAKYEESTKIDGLEAYVYNVTVNNAKIEIAKGVPGTYFDVKEIFVEPKTGAIINQTDNQQRYLADGTQALDLKLAFTDQQVKQSASDAKDNIKSLSLVTTVFPLVGFIGGGLVLLVALLLLLSGRGRRRSRASLSKS